MRICVSDCLADFEQNGAVKAQEMRKRGVRRSKAVRQEQNKADEMKEKEKRMQRRQEA